MERSAEQKFRIIQAVSKSANLVDACTRFKISRQTYYVWCKAYQEKGVGGLSSARKVPHPKNRVDESVESAVVEFAMTNPMIGQNRAAEILHERGVKVAAGTVRAIWLRNGLGTEKERVDAIARMGEE